MSETPEEPETVVNNRPYDHNKGRHIKINPISLRNLRRHKLGGSKSVVTELRRGIVREKRGESAANVAAALKMSTVSYSRGRDVVLLAARNDLSQKQAQLATAALEYLDVKGVNAAYLSVRHIVQSVWGKRGNRFTGDKTRQMKFINEITFISHISTRPEGIQIPPLPEADRQFVVGELQRARRALKKLHARILKGGMK